MRAAKIALFLFALTLAGLQAATYYVSSQAGDDNAVGTTPGTAWKSIAKVNSMTFGSDTLLFACGGVWSGVLEIKGTGSAGRPFLVSKYGTGAMPVINGGGADYTVHFLNQEYFTLSNLEVTNIGTPNQVARQGVLVDIAGFGKVAHDITIRDLYIHDVDGQYSGAEWVFHRSAAIRTRWDGQTGVKYDNLLIEGNRIERVHAQGIYVACNGASSQGTKTQSTRVLIRNNYLETIGGDGIILQTCNNGIAEHNTLAHAGWMIVGCCAGIWSIYDGNGVIVQFNEIYSFLDNDCDGQPFDSDWREHNQINQYNYTHDCNGGVFLNMNDASGATLRYNISQNDGDHTHFLFDLRSFDPCYIYNNVFYIPSTAGYPISFSNFDDKPNTFNNTFNNIFINVKMPIRGSNNCFFGLNCGTGTANNGNIVADPMLVAPGTGDTGFASTGGYKLKANSPCIGKGKRIAGMGVRDFFGNTLPSTGAIDIGAHQYSNQTTVASDLSALKMSVPAIVERGEYGVRIRLLDKNIIDARLLSPSGKVVAILSAKGKNSYTVDKVSSASVVYYVEVRMGKERRAFPLVVY